MGLYYQAPPNNQAAVHLVQGGPPVSNPPFAQRVPVEAKDPSRLYYGDGQQYGFVFRSSAFGNGTDLLTGSGAYLNAGTGQRIRIRSSALASPVVFDEPPGCFVPPDWSSWPFLYDDAPYRAAQPYRIAAIAAPVVNNPPFAQRIPVEAKELGRSYYGDGQQYGFVTRSSTLKLASSDLLCGSGAYLNTGAGQRIRVMAIVNNPPFAQRRPIFSKSIGVYYGDEFQYGFSYANDVGQVARPKAAVNAPSPITVSGLIRSTWPQDSWPAQRAFADRVAPYPGDEPPGCYVPPDYGQWPYPTWQQQSMVSASAALTIPILASPPPGVPFNTASAVLGTWMPATWAAQSVYNPVVVLSLTYGQQPPPYSPENLYQARASWIDTAWGKQSSSGQIGSGQVPLNAQPTPARLTTVAMLRQAWPVDSWSAQRAFNPVAPLTLRYGQTPPKTSWARFYALRSTWPDPIWSVQSEPDGAPIAVAPYVPLFHGEPSIAIQMAIRASWLEATWTPSKIARLVQSTTRGSKPTPQLIAALWPAESWTAQRAAAVVTIVTPAIVNNPPPSSRAALTLIASAWLPGPPLPPTFSGVGKPNVGQLATDPNWVLVVPYRSFTVHWISDEWEH